MIQFLILAPFVLILIGWIFMGVVNVMVRAQDLINGTDNYGLIEHQKNRTGPYAKGGEFYDPFY